MPEKLFAIAGESCPRLDRWLAARWPEFSRVRWSRAIASGSVAINSSPAAPSAAVKAGDRIEAVPPPPADAATDALPEAIPLDIIYEDDSLLCVNKPPGLVVHPAAGHWKGTLVNAILHHCPSLSAGSHPLRPGIVHRLDKDTSGCILIAKTNAAHTALARQFADRTAQKHYLAVVRGRPRMAAGVITAAIARHPVHRREMTIANRSDAREAETLWRFVAGTNRLSLLECRPKTGRTHQIRVHLKHLGHPVAGDRVYGGGADFPRQLLHAWKISITHPIANTPLAFESPVPKDFPDELREKLTEYDQRLR